MIVNSFRDKRKKTKRNETETILLNMRDSAKYDSIATGQLFKKRKITRISNYAE